MIKWIQEGDLLRDEADLLVVPVNVVGVMGGGLAKSFADVFPQVLKPYRAACLSGALVVGSVWRHGRLLCLPTKQHWKDPSKLSYVVKGVDAMDRYCQEHNIRSVAVPKLGCGLGGLKWVEVRPVLIQALDRSPVEYRVYGEAP